MSSNGGSARGGYDVMRHTETLRQLGAVSVMPVEQLQDPGRLAGGPDPILHAVAEERIDRPDAAGGDEHVRTARHELIHDPTEAAVELVAETGGSSALPHRGPRLVARKVLRAGNAEQLVDVEWNPAELDRQRLG